MSTAAGSLTVEELGVLGTVAQAMLWDETWGLFVAEDVGDNLDQLFELRENFRTVNALIRLPLQVPLCEESISQFLDALPERGAAFSTLLAEWLEDASAAADPVGPEVIPAYLTRMREDAAAAVTVMERLGY